MKGYAKYLIVAVVVGGLIAVPVIFYGTIAYVVVHFIKKLW